MATLKQALRSERDSMFYRLRGGYPIALAGAVWWALLGALGYRLHSHNLWIFIAFATSGMIFPLAILLGQIFGIKFLRDRTSVSDVLFPTLASMLLFWPVAISAFWTCPDLVPLVLAVGMSAAWPVMGWMYGRTALYTAHAIVRAVVAFVLWNWFPSTRFTVLPLAICALYLGTIAVILVVSSGPQRSDTVAER